MGAVVLPHKLFLLPRLRSCILTSAYGCRLLPSAYTRHSSTPPTAVTALSSNHNSHADAENALLLRDEKTVHCKTAFCNTLICALQSLEPRSFLSYFSYYSTVRPVTEANSGKFPLPVSSMEKRQTEVFWCIIYANLHSDIKFDSKNTSPLAR